MRGRSRVVALALLLSALGVALGVSRAAPERSAQPKAAAPAASSPASVGPGSLVRVRAKSELGVPVHPSPDSPSVSGRIPHGSSVRILTVGKDRRWFEIEAGDVRGFVTQRYLELPASGANARVPPESPWFSREACLLALKQPRAARDPKLVRAGSWNLHWFPDGGPGRARPDSGTDIDWLACAIALLEVDVLAVQELKDGPHAEHALLEVRTRLEELTGRSFRWLLDDCPPASSQHVGFLYDERRARLVRHATLAELNPHGEPCKDQLRPGLAGYFAFPGGLDLSIVAVHLKSGPGARDLELRDRSFQAFGRAAEALRTLTKDRDVLVLGDMNTMGCESCVPSLRAVDELARAGSRLSAAAFRRVPSESSCSHYYSGKATLLDWAAATSLAELPPARRLAVSGVCGELGCSPPRGEQAAQRRLSDHCPFFVDIDDRDLD
ncbi:MAG TPA: hypothetical protein VGK73_19340 [Polyangiaceae bacterium]